MKTNNAHLRLEWRNIQGNALKKTRAVMLVRDITVYIYTNSGWGKDMEKI